MSFNWKTNMIGGQSSPSHNFSQVSIAGTFPQNGYHLVVPSNVVQNSQLYNVGAYVTLGDMTDDKQSLLTMRGGSNGMMPGAQAKMAQCLQASSTNVRCNQNMSMY